MFGDYILPLLLFCIGIAITIGKVLVSEEKYSFKVIVGKAILNGMTSLMAGLILLTFTSASPLVILAGGAFLGTIGTESTLAFIKSKLNIEENKDGSN